MSDFNYSSGNHNSDFNSGNGNSGDFNSGNFNSGNYNSGSHNSGNGNSGNHNNGNSNMGNHNKGDNNKGNCNSGEYNSGDYNIGDYNSGNSNIGAFNSGNHNNGKGNSGDRNKGASNRGDCNKGDHNRGDWNKCNFSGGCFNTICQTICMFNKPSPWTYEDWVESDARHILGSVPRDKASFVEWSEMTDEEKAAHPEAEITGGYLKEIKVDDTIRQAWWNSLSEEGRALILSLPNFDADIFREITGVDVMAKPDQSASSTNYF